MAIDGLIRQMLGAGPKTRMRNKTKKPCRRLRRKFALPLSRGGRAVPHTDSTGKRAGHCRPLRFGYEAEGSSGRARQPLAKPEGDNDRGRNNLKEELLEITVGLGRRLGSSACLAGLRA